MEWGWYLLVWITRCLVVGRLSPRPLNFDAISRTLAHTFPITNNWFLNIHVTGSMVLEWGAPKVGGLGRNIAPKLTKKWWKKSVTRGNKRHYCSIHKMCTTRQLQ